MEETKTLQEEFAEKAKKFLRESYPSDKLFRNGVLNIDEVYEDVVQEIHWQIADWYEGCSYYPKPEDILVDYLQFSPLDAHRFLPLFPLTYDGESVTPCGGKDSCPL